MASILGGKLYIVERVGPNDHTVSRAVLKDGNVTPDGQYRVVRDDCSCRAGDFDNMCKHRRMVANTLEGAGMPREEAGPLFDQFLENMKKSWDDAIVASLLPYKSDPTVKVASALIQYGDNESGSERLVIWGEYKGLLTRIYYFKDYDAYKKTLRKIQRGAE